MISNDNPNDDTLLKIKKAKELLDCGAINQEEFDNIKSKYLNQVSGHDNSSLAGIVSENMDEICTMFPIPDYIHQLGKHDANYVINYISGTDIEEKIKEIYLNENKQDDETLNMSKRVKMIHDKLTPIPEKHLKILFLIENMPYKSKKEFIDQVYWDWNRTKIKKFYKKYELLLTRGFRKKDFKKIFTELDIKNICRIFNISDSKRILGEGYVIKQIFKKYSEEEINEKLKVEFNLQTIANEDLNPENIEKNYENKSFKTQITDLKIMFELKKQNTYELIEKCFPSPQMTNTKFKGNVEECSKIFYQKTDNLMLIINSSSEYPAKLENEIKYGISILKEINNKLDSFNTELLINMSDSNDENYENVLEEMDMLIDSVKDY